MYIAVKTKFANNLTSLRTRSRVCTNCGKSSIKRHLLAMIKDMGISIYKVSVPIIYKL